uniref:Crisp-like n=1 Tax=Xenopus tropicalis TaxID=8364 RepID=A0A803JBD6_XENTR
MIPIVILCLSICFQYSATESEIAWIPTAAPFSDYGNDTTQHPAGGSRRKRAGGRKITIPPENIEKMKNVPFSALSTDLESNRQSILNVHNELRRNANPPPSNMLKMVWSDLAAKSAAKWANSCKQYHSLKPERTIPGFSCGENLFMASYKASWEDVIRAFYSEIEDFLYGKGAKEVGLQILHFTQVMWFSSWLVGCAAAQCPITDHSLEFYFVCHYAPAGNYGNVGIPYKTGKPCEDCKSSCENGLCTNGCNFQNKFSNCDTPDTHCDTDPTAKNDCPATCNCLKEIH